MSFECDPCHVIATGRTHAETFHLSGSRGPCETCGIVSNCADCHCSGDWAKARAERRPVPNYEPQLKAIEKVTLAFTEALARDGFTFTEEVSPKDFENNLKVKVGDLTVSVAVWMVP